MHTIKCNQHKITNIPFHFAYYTPALISKRRPKIIKIKLKTVIPCEELNLMKKLKGEWFLFTQSSYSLSVCTKCKKLITY